MLHDPPPLLCFPLQQASVQQNPFLSFSSSLSLSFSLSLSLILSFSLAFLFISHLPLLLHLCHYCFVATRMHTHVRVRVYRVCAPYPFPSNKTVHRLWIRDWLLFRKYNAPTATTRGGVPGESNSITFSHNSGWNTPGRLRATTARSVGSFWEIAPCVAFHLCTEKSR